MKNELKKIRKDMEKTLDPKRFQHTLGVEYTAAALAMRYGEDIKNARLAGLLHDSAKCMTDERRLAICEKHNITVTEVERRNPFLLHSKVGGFLAMNKYGIKDMNVVNAILYHTTGRPNMSLLEKIIFVADYIEPNRKDSNNIKDFADIRQEAFIDLDKAMLKILQNTLDYLKELGRETDPMTKKTYDYYLKEVKGGKDGDNENN